jgi:GNAT superfamily N-acetyltransferase
MVGDTMQDSYYDFDKELQRLTTVHLMKFSDTECLITEIQTTRGARRLGRASALMKQVLSQADCEGVTLLLGIDPDGSEGSMDYDQLVAWYRRMGFRYHISEDEGAMRREPQSAKASTT